MTLKALSFIDNLTDESLIADLGCGTGGQTMTLARHAPGRITGLDFFPGFIDRFNADARRLHLADRVKGVVGSMDALPFRAGELDLIWSEGAIYNIGFERGLNEWREYLKPGGYLAVSESVWFTDERPTEIHDFWVDAYPEIDTIPNKVAQIHRAGYLPVAAFVLPETCWMEHYFAPLAKARELFAAKYPGDSTAEGLMAFQRYEEELYRKYNEFYGYVFSLRESRIRAGRCVPVLCRIPVRRRVPVRRRLPALRAVDDLLDALHELLRSRCALYASQQLALRVEDQIERNGSAAVTLHQLLARGFVGVVFGRDETLLHEVADILAREDFAFHHPAGRAPRGVEVDEDQLAALDRHFAHGVRRFGFEFYLSLRRTRSEC